MKLTKREQETIINWNRTKDPISISTFDEALANRLMLAGYTPTEKRTYEQGISSYEFEVPKEVLAIRVKKVVSLSDEDKMKVVARLKAGRKAAKNKKSSD